MTRFIVVTALVLALIGGGLGIGWLIWGRRPAPPAPITVTPFKPEPAPAPPAQKPDSSKLAKIAALEARLAKFLADSANQTPDPCRALLAECSEELTGLKAMVTAPRRFSVTLTNDSLPYIHPQVIYTVDGDSAWQQWSFTQFWEKFPRVGETRVKKGRGVGRVGIGGGASFAQPTNARAGIRLRVKQNFILGVDKNMGRPGWGLELTYFLI